MGHGLGVVQQSDKFPHEMHVFALNSGHFASYAKSRGLAISEIAVQKKPKVWSEVTEADRPKLISVADLLLRVPEMQLLAPECLGKRPLSFRIAKTQDLSSAMWGKSNKGSATTTTRGSILIEPNGTVTVDWLESLGLPFANIEAVTAVQKYHRPHFVGEVQHPSEDLWWDHFEHYESDRSGKSIISPFWGTADALILHLVTLYALSIVVRYLPSLWQRVERGDLDHIRAMLEGYMSEFDHVGSAMALGRITGRTLILTQPGTFGAPI